MKKLVFFAFIAILLYLLFPSKGMFQQASSEQGYQEIPGDAIRLRILANSDNDKDQDLKLTVRDEVNKAISGWVKDIDNIDEARELIQGKLPEIENIVQNVLEEENAAQNFDVDYGDKVDFPKKVYGNYLYPAGEYEAVVITLGEGNGENWWCVLFPPLCFLDFSDEGTVAEAADEEEEDLEQEEEEQETEVKFFLFEWLGLS